MAIYLLSDYGVDFPSPHLADPEGLLAVGGDLSVERLLAAYRQGIFPWYEEGFSPILWWSTNPRCVLLPQNFHAPASVNKLLRQGRFNFTVDTAFSEVMHMCAKSARSACTEALEESEAHKIEDNNSSPGTWIGEAMIEAYTRLHRAGFAHSMEAWQDGKMVGGLYGISLGSVFFGESMFYEVPNASKAAFVKLMQNLIRQGCTLVDCQQTTAHLMRFGAAEMPRSAFMSMLKKSLRNNIIDFAEFKL